jgi:hypothetical protein
MIWAFVVGLGYAAFARAAFAYEPLKPILGIVTMSFVFLVPLAFGSLVVYFGAKTNSKWGWGDSFGMPCLLTLTCLVGTALAGFEAIICVLMAAPIMLIMAMLGGVITFAIVKKNRRGRQGKLLVSFFVLLPYAIAPIENMLALPQSLQTTDTQIEIAAAPEKVWENIARVRTISPTELKPNPVYWIGFPRPIEATLSHDGIGGVRHATFERHVLFIETVTSWEQARKLSFTIHADGDFIPPATFDRHVTVGGKFFDVLSGTYEIEPLGQNRVILHLSSSHRLSTRFNWYAGLWSNWIMSHIQDSILYVIKLRCEAVG